MEEVLDLYAEPYDPAYPTVCLDEKPVVLAHPNTPTRADAQPGQKWNDATHGIAESTTATGTADLFVMVEPLGRLATCRGHRAAYPLDFADCLRYWSKTITPRSPMIRLVVDNLTPIFRPRSTNVPPRQERARSWRALEFHYTPKHGSWLNMAEIEFSVFERGCLSRPVGDLSTLRQRVNALVAERNAARATIQWQFTSPQARVKLADLYPVTKSKPD